jgi:glyoxylase-like metal-dependent hydrolase (beta-lactamase superfamily II)
MPIDYKKYHVDWKDIIRPDILKRDGYKCANCKISNRTKYTWDNKVRVILDDEWLLQQYIEKGHKISKVVLTIAHLDHSIDNVEYTNLAALCQYCHLRYDKHQHMLSRLANTKKKIDNGK